MTTRTRKLWTPSAEQVEGSNLTRFIGFLAATRGVDGGSYEALWSWSVEERAAFWDAVWDFSEVVSERKGDHIAEDIDLMPGTRWFPDARLNFAENLLRHRDERPALVFRGEGASGSVRMTYAELSSAVAGTAAALRAEGVVAGDRVVGFLPNLCETVVAMLATTSIGAVWSSGSPDFGVKGALDRFGQVEPVVLFCADGYRYNGKTFDSLDRVAAIVENLPTVRRVVVVPYVSDEPAVRSIRGAVHFRDFVARDAAQPAFERLPFDHPLYVLYSSGTTGMPKCILHGAGGTLLQHLKELALHTDVTRDDVVFYYTTCGWMMWNWLVSNLALGAAVLLYDGSPLHPDPGVLWRIAQEERVTVFGTSPRYLTALEKSGYRPADSADLSALRTILSTGAPLPVRSFHYVYRDIKPDVRLSSISGGTDIISCFALGNPTGPVYEGEMQARGLGMKVEAYDHGGRPVLGRKGELVCTRSFPSMPIGFWNDPGGARFRDTYFGVYDNVWYHGDYVEITATGGVVIHGRSDATLNPGGVRIGTAEIYRVVEAMEEVADSLVVGQTWEDDVRVLLFVKPAEGVAWDDGLAARIGAAIRANATPRHVPAKILPVADIPYTITGKKVEIAVRQVIHGEEVRNRHMLANPQALDLYQGLEALRS